jgi:WD40 repeat protein
MRRFVVCLAIWVLTGCGINAPLPLRGSATYDTSPIGSAGSRGALVYVATGPHVYVYSFPKGDLVQRLQGFRLPTGICTDPAGNVWIADVQQSLLVEYSHGGNKPIATLIFPHKLGPYDCSVDPQSGNLAAVSSDGSVAVFPAAHGKPALFRLFYMEGVSYDDRGNLFAVGPNLRSHKPIFLELARGTSKFVHIQLSKSFAYPYRLRWDGKYLAMTMSNESYIYRFSVIDRTAKEEGATELGPSFDPLFFSLHRGYAVVSNQRKVTFWSYPQGKLLKTLDHIKRPYGVAISATP